MFLIYKATNKTNGKVYIGKTNALGRRKREHWSSAKRGLDTLFCRALRKYGVDGFQFETLERLPTEVLAYEAEQRLIQQFRANDRCYGYNLTAGGDGLRANSITPEERQRRSERGKAYIGAKNPFFGKVHTPETRQAIREARRQYHGPRHPFWGHHHQAATKAKISQTKLDRRHQWTEDERAQIGHRSAGERSATAKISNQQAEELRHLAAQGVPRRQLQAMYNLSKASVCKVILRQTFKESNKWPL